MFKRKPHCSVTAGNVVARPEGAVTLIVTVLPAAHPLKDSATLLAKFSEGCPGVGRTSAPGVPATLSIVQLDGEVVAETWVPAGIGNSALSALRSRKLTLPVVATTLVIAGSVEANSSTACCRTVAARAPSQVLTLDGNRPAAPAQVPVAPRGTTNSPVSKALFSSSSR